MYSISSNVKNHRLYNEFAKVKSRLAKHQFVCWIAGGAVRDFCLGREVNEFDLVTDATTEALKSLFPEAVLVGESFGVLKIPLMNNEFFDLATFRQESDYIDGRRPSQVSAATPYKDSERRDFTINAMFWDDVQNTIIDYKGGLFDIFNKRIACVGDPEVRFSEDYLRIIRLVRFSSVLNFEIEASTNDAAIKYRSKINQVSGERVWSELLKINKAFAWGAALKQKLFLTLLEEVFETKEIKTNGIIAEGADIFLKIYMLNPEIDFSELLKRKLKLSNYEISLYNSVRFVMGAVAKLSVEELAYEVERNTLYDQRLKDVTEVGLVRNYFFKSVEQIINLYKEPLIAAKDLVDLIPNREISSELKFLRIGQFEGKYGTKAEALDYLRKKYAK